MLSSSASCSASKGLHAKYRPPTSRVGTFRRPLLALMTIFSPDGSSSIFTSRKLMPRSFKKDLARQQSGHHLVLYMVIGSIVSSASPHWMLAVEVSRKQCHAKSNRSASRARNKGAALLGGHLDADQRALQRDVGAVPINIWIVGGQSLLGASQSILRALQVDFFRAFGGLRKNRDAVRKNFGKSSNDGEIRGFLASRLVIAEFADPQFRHERCVPGQNTQGAVLAWHFYVRDPLAEQLFLRGDDHQFNGIGHHSSLRVGLHFFGFLERFLDRTDHVKRLFRNAVVLPFHDFLEAADGVFDLDVLAFEPGELRGHEHRLGKKFFDLARAHHGALVFIGKFFD